MTAALTRTPTCETRTGTPPAHPLLPRLPRIKAKWDPCNIFRHLLSIAPPGS
ncbi:BBE domain-containing protein [Nocardia colli]|uniref:BBE domain-containing protein n=1 Tax=Nocardia colli TaxID=2545717 RepID=UPI001CC35B43